MKCTVKLAGDPGFAKIKSANSNVQVIREIYYPRTKPALRYIFNSMSVVLAHVNTVGVKYKK